MKTHTKKISKEDIEYVVNWINSHGRDTMNDWQDGYIHGWIRAKYGYETDLQFFEDAIKQGEPLWEGFAQALAKVIALVYPSKKEVSE